MTFGEGENFHGFRSYVAQADADRMVAAAYPWAIPGPA
jgi:hypothetical protein